MPRCQRLAVLPVVLLTLALSGCGSGGPSGTKETPVPSDSGNDVNRTDRDQLVEGGTLRWPIAQLPPNFNTGQLDGSLADTGAVMGDLLGSPFYFDAAGEAVLSTDYV